MEIVSILLLGLGVLCIALMFKYVVIVNEYSVKQHKLVVKHSNKTVEIPIDIITEIISTYAPQVAKLRSQSNYVFLNNPYFPFYTNKLGNYLVVDTIILMTSIGENYVLYFPSEQNRDLVISLVSEDECSIINKDEEVV